MKAEVVVHAVGEVRGPDGEVKETFPVTFTQVVDIDDDALGSDTTQED